MASSVSVPTAAGPETARFLAHLASSAGSLVFERHGFGPADGAVEPAGEPQHDAA